jgi:hypothetical protein
MLNREDNAVKEDRERFGDECRRVAVEGPIAEDPSPSTTLRQLPALILRERLPVPVLAVGTDGTIL